MQSCGEVMTENVVCCTPSDTAIRAAELMRQEDVGSLPVVEQGASRKLVGMVTDRDLAMRVIAEGRHPSDVSIGEVMSTSVEVCRPNDTLEAALDRMSSAQVRRIPVVNDNNEVVGIIAQADIALRVDAPRETGRVVEDISRPDDRQ